MVTNALPLFIVEMTILFAFGAQSNIHKPKHYTDGTIRCPMPWVLVTTLDSHNIEPTCFSIKVNIGVLHQLHAMADDEFNTFLKNGTWTLVHPTSTMNIVDCKWIFRIKRKLDGCIDRYKARLVAQSFHRRPGFNYADTYSPVMKPITICIVLSLEVSCGWPH